MLFKWWNNLYSKKSFATWCNHRALCNQKIDKVPAINKIRLRECFNYLNKDTNYHIYSLYLLSRKIHCSTLFISLGLSTKIKSTSNEIVFINFNRKPFKRESSRGSMLPQRCSKGEWFVRLLFLPTKSGLPTRLLAHFVVILFFSSNPH